MTHWAHLFSENVFYHLAKTSNVQTEEEKWWQAHTSMHTVWGCPVVLPTLYTGGIPWFIINHSHKVTQSGLLTALSNTQQTNIQKIDIMYICAHSCLWQSQSKGKTPQKKKQPVAGDYVKANNFFSATWITLIQQNIIRYNCTQLTENNTIRLKLTQVANSDWKSMYKKMIYVRKTLVQNGRGECPTAPTESPYSQFAATKFYRGILLLCLI